jgi:DTW domain-containing protein YfiP
MCGFCQKVQTQTKFVILMHPKEFKKVKNNTGYFTHLSLPNSELFVGIDFSHNSRINEIIASHESYILFPSVNAVNLTTTNPKRSEQPLAIFLIDSTWACTKKIFTQSKNLQNLQHMSFTTPKTSQYEIKIQPDENYLSTMESTLVVLELLQKWEIETIGKKQIEGFLRPFYEMIAYQKKCIANPQSHAVRFKRHGVKA